MRCDYLCKEKHTCFAKYETSKLSSRVKTILAENMTFIKQVQKDKEIMEMQANEINEKDD